MLYRSAEGVLVQCCHCRRVRRIEEPMVWDWVPAWLTAGPEGTSHGLCEPCVGFHYSKEQMRSRAFAEPFKTWR